MALCVAAEGVVVTRCPFLVAEGRQAVVVGLGAQHIGHGEVGGEGKGAVKVGDGGDVVAHGDKVHGAADIVDGAGLVRGNVRVVVVDALEVLLNHRRVVELRGVWRHYQHHAQGACGVEVGDALYIIGVLTYLGGR